jgi:hypothetical protein
MLAFSLTTKQIACKKNDVKASLNICASLVQQISHMGDVD